MIRRWRRSGRRWARVSVVAVAIGFSSCTCNDLAGPDAQLREAAKALESTRELPEAKLHIDTLQITRITPEPELSPPRVVFSFDLEGRVPPANANDDLATSVSAIGVERVPMEKREGAWRPLGATLPRLAEVLDSLESRDEARKHVPRALQWVIRVDLDKILVTEEQSGNTRQMLELHPLADGGLAFVP